MIRRLYVDTSAYLAVRTGGASVAEEMKGAEVLASSLLVLEAQRTLVHTRAAKELGLPT